MVGSVTWELIEPLGTDSFFMKFRGGVGGVHHVAVASMGPAEHRHDIVPGGSWQRSSASSPSWKTG